MFDYRKATYSPVSFIGTNCRLSGASSGAGEVQLVIPTTGPLDFSLWVQAADIAEMIFGDWAGPVDDADAERRADAEDDGHNDTGSFYQQFARDNPKQVP